MGGIFLGRKRELGKLEKAWKDDGLHCSIVYGRRRSGKTTVLENFSRDKPTVFFTAMKKSRDENLCLLNQAVEDSPLAGKLPRFGNLLDAFKGIVEYGKKEKFLFVVDEASFLNDAWETCFDHLAQIIEKGSKAGSMVNMILCGSSLSFMAEQILDIQSPMYGRHDTRLEISPFTYPELLDAGKDFNPHDLAMLYGITGGTPELFLKLDPELGTEGNMCALFADVADLFRDPEIFLRHELPDSTPYMNVMAAIANGKTTFNDIAGATRLPFAKAREIAKRLVKIGVIRNDLPAFGPSFGNGLLFVKDHYFRTWFKYMRNGLERDGDRLAAHIMADMPSHMGQVFEDICKQWSDPRCMAMYDRYLNPPRRWWGKNPDPKVPEGKKSEEIDMVMENERGFAVFGECKWRNRTVTKGILKDLVRKSNFFEDIDEKRYILFSKGDFTDDCLNEAKRMNDAAGEEIVKTFTLDDMCRIHLGERDVKREKEKAGPTRRPAPGFRQ